MQKIVAVLNDFEKADLVLGRALTLATEQRIPLEVLFVHEKPFFSIPDFFLPKEDSQHNSVDKTKIKNEIKERLLRLGHKETCAIFVFVDDTADRIHTQTKDQSQILIVAVYHQKLTESILKKNHLPLLILKKDHRGTPNEATQNIVLPIELNESTVPCIDLTKVLFPHSSIKLIYDNHFQTDPETKKERMIAYQILQEKTGLKGDTIEEFAWNQSDFGEDYDAIEEHLLNYIHNGVFGLTVLCSQKGHFLFTEALSFSLLHALETDCLLYRDCHVQE